MKSEYVLKKENIYPLFFLHSSCVQVFKQLEFEEFGLFVCLFLHLLFKLELVDLVFKNL